MSMNKVKNRVCEIVVRVAAESTTQEGSLKRQDRQSNPILSAVF